MKKQYGILCYRNPESTLGEAIRWAKDENGDVILFDTCEYAQDEARRMNSECRSGNVSYSACLFSDTTPRQ